MMLSAFIQNPHVKISILTTEENLNNLTLCLNKLLLRNWPNPDLNRSARRCILLAVRRCTDTRESIQSFLKNAAAPFT